VQLVRDGCDVAGGDRLAGWPGAMSLANWLANRAFGVLASVRARRRLRDVHSGQRAYRAAVLGSFAMARSLVRPTYTRQYQPSGRPAVLAHSPHPSSRGG